MPWFRWVERLRDPTLFRGYPMLGLVRTRPNLRGLGEEPVVIGRVDALERNHEDRGRAVGVHLLDRGADLSGKRGPGLDDHHRFLAALDLTLPAIMGNHARQNVDAGTQPALDQGSAGLLRLDNRGLGRIDENCALHMQPPPAAAPAAASGPSS